MRVALVTNFYPPIQTGSSNWARELAKAHLAAGDEVVVVTAGRGEAVGSATEDGVPVYRLPSFFTLPRLHFFLNFNQFHLMASPANRQRLRTILRDHRVEIIHQSNHLLDSMFLSLRVARDLDIPAVCTIHSQISHSTSRLYDVLMRSVDRGALRLAMNRFDCIIPLDATMAFYVQGTYQPRDMELLPVSCLTTAEVDALVPATPGDVDPEGVVRIASVGHVTENRNRAELIRALPALVKAGVDPRLEIAGKVLSQTAPRLADALGVTANVRFCGEVRRADLFDFLRPAHLESHLFHLQGLGLATLEAMAMGLPVVCNAHEDIYGAVPLRHGENIVFADPKNQSQVDEALLALVRDPGLRQSMGQKARTLIKEHLVWDVVINRFKQLYQRYI